MRIVSSLCVMVLAVLLVVTAFPVAGLAAAGDDGSPYSVSINEITDSKGNVILTSRGNNDIDITYSYKQINPGFTADDIPNSETISDSKSYSIKGGFERTSKTEVIFSISSINDDNTMTCSVTLTHVNYKGSPKALWAQFTTSAYSIEYTSTIPSTTIPDEFFDRSSGSSSGNSGNSGTSDDPAAPSADIVIESVSVTDKDGKIIDEVTKETEAFNISLVYVDYGLEQYDVYDTDELDLQVYLTNAGSFLPSGTNMGTIKPVISRSNSDAPRFRVDFKNVTWDGVSNQISIQVRYSIDGYSFKGETQANVYQAKTKKEDEEEDPIVPPPTPYIIVTQYSSGEEQIEAGQRFNLGLTFKNTSDTVGLENIVMTVDPGEEITIASASNTYYINNLAAGASLQHTLELEAKPAAKVGSHNINVTFTYEYLVEKTKKTIERVSKESKEVIAVSITQIDRFAVDPITEVPSGLVGETAYITVTFINRGVSTTNNITGFAKSKNLEIIAPSEHYGTLEGGGKSDSIEVTVVPQEAGELFGDVIIQYEDDNRNQKELSVPFTMYVDAPYVPEQPQDPGMIDPGMMNQAPATNWTQIILCVVGGLLMAAPIALYLMKRVKAKGSEDFEDDF